MQLISKIYDNFVNTMNNFFNDCGQGAQLKTALQHKIQ